MIWSKGDLETEYLANSIALYFSKSDCDIVAESFDLRYLSGKDKDNKYAAG